MPLGAGLRLRCANEGDNCLSANMFCEDGFASTVAGYGTSEESATEDLVIKLRRVIDDHAAEHDKNPKHQFFRDEALKQKYDPDPSKHKRMKA